MRKRMQTAVLAIFMACGLAGNSMAAEPAPQSAIDACSEEAKKAQVISEELATFINTCLTDAGYSSINVKSESTNKLPGDKG